MADEAVVSLPTKEGISARFRTSWARRDPRDRIKPLRRWLDKQVGRPWNDVWGEVCRQFPRRALMNKHLQDHLLGLVELEHNARNNRVRAS